MKTIEEKLRDFLLNRVLPLMTDELEEGYPLKSDLITREFVFNEKNYGAFLEQWFSTSWVETGKDKCVNKIIKDRGLTLLQLLIFIVKHNLNFCDNAGHYVYGGCYFYLNKKTSISIPFSIHGMLLGGKLKTAVKSGFDYLKANYCGKNYPPSDSNFNYVYWKIQAELFFKKLPPISNRGCSNKKSGITWNKECKNCAFFNKEKDYTCCEFDYDKYKDKYNRYTKIGFNLFLPDNGKTYACKHFKFTPDEKRKYKKS
ncbi:MAG TPA: hypothetical protein ENH85_06835 [Candidatus Scalindua sp.]|nr:hypothetical protein [Candidatus Scalindua sp.]